MAWRLPQEKTQGEKVEDFCKGVGEVAGLFGQLLSFGAEVASAYNEIKRETESDYSCNRGNSLTKYENTDGEKTEDFLRDASKIAIGVSSFGYAASDVASVSNRRHRQIRHDAWGALSRKTDGEKAQDFLRDAGTLSNATGAALYGASQFKEVYDRHQRQDNTRDNYPRWNSSSMQEESDEDDSIKIGEVEDEDAAIDTMKNVFDVKNRRTFGEKDAQFFNAKISPLNESKKSFEDRNVKVGGTKELYEYKRSTNVHTTKNSPKVEPKDFLKDESKNVGDTDTKIFSVVETKQHNDHSKTNYSPNAGTSLSGMNDNYQPQTGGEAKSTKRKDKQKQFHKKTDGEKTQQTLRDAGTVANAVGSACYAGSKVAGVYNKHNKHQQRQVYTSQDIRGQKPITGYEKSDGGETTVFNKADVGATNTASSSTPEIGVSAPKIVSSNDQKQGNGKSRNRRRKKKNKQNFNEKSDGEKVQEIFRDAGTIAHAVGNACHAGAQIADVCNKQQRRPGGGYSHCEWRPVSYHKHQQQLYPHGGTTGGENLRDFATVATAVGTMCHAGSRIAGVCNKYQDQQSDNSYHHDNNRPPSRWGRGGGYNSHRGGGYNSHRGGRQGNWDNPRPDNQRSGNQKPDNQRRDNQRQAIQYVSAEDVDNRINESRDFASYNSKKGQKAGSTFGSENSDNYFNEKCGFAPSNSMMAQKTMSKFE